MANNLTGGGVGGIQLNNLGVIHAKLHKVGQAMADKLNRRALKKSLAPVAKRARQLAPVGKSEKDALAGMLRDSIGEVIVKKKGVVRGIVGPIRRRVRVGTITRGKRKGQAIYKDPVRYAHLQEFGTSHHGKHPFMRPAWDEAGGEKALATYTDELNKGLDEEVRKL